MKKAITLSSERVNKLSKIVSISEGSRGGKRGEGGGEGGGEEGRIAGRSAILECFDRVSLMGEIIEGGREEVKGEEVKGEESEKEITSEGEEGEDIGEMGEEPMLIMVRIGALFGREFAKDPDEKERREEEADISKTEGEEDMAIEDSGDEQREKQDEEKEAAAEEEEEADRTGNHTSSKSHFPRSFDVQ